jgi:PAS domain S-box-containing protein
MLSKHLKVLLIEDSENDAAMNIRMLEKAGFTLSFVLVEAAAEMQSALSREHFDLVLSDHNLPHFGSAEALALLRKGDRDTPFIIVSGAIGEEVAVQLMKSGAQDYVMKSNLARLAPAVERELKDAEVRRERQQSAEKLCASEERFNRVVDTAGEVIWEVSPEMLYLYVNPVVEKVMGYKPEQVIGKMRLFDLTPLQDRIAYQANIKKYFLGKESYKHLIHSCTCKDGREIILESCATPVLDEKGNLRGYCGTDIDITERKMLEARISQLYETEKTQRQQLQEETELKNIFTDVLAHELRNSLSPLFITSDILLSTPDLQEEMRNKLNLNMNAGINLLAKRLDELLDLARFSKGNVELKLQNTDIHEFIDQVVDRFKPSLDKRRQRLILDIDVEKPFFTIDKSRMEQVVVNLLSNADKYSPENSEIRMKVKTDVSGLLLEVTDRGIGIDPEDQKNLFQPYFRADKTKSVSGTGLGLWLSKKIIEAHGGQIWITSQLGRFSTFSIHIPLDKELAVAEKEAGIH